MEHVGAGAHEIVADAPGQRGDGLALGADHRQPQLAQLLRLARIQVGGRLPALDLQY